MKFIRRPDIDNLARLQIAAQAFLGRGVYGEITRIARSYQVSRLFVYKLLWQLMLVYELEVRETCSVEAIRKKIDQHILLMRFEGFCSLEAISQILKQLGLPFSSVGYISQRLGAYARAVPKENLTDAKIVFLLCDEIFTCGRPILITADPRSLAILKIELVENRDGETWKKHWEGLSEAGLIKNQTVVVSDQGSGLVRGCALMGLIHHPDLFHLLRPLARFGNRFYRKALKAIAWEYDRGSLDIGKSDRVINKRMAAYEKAKADALEKIERYDNFCYLWKTLREALELFDPKGQINDLATRKAEIEAILSLMNELGSEELKKEVKSFASGLEGYWNYYQRAGEVYQRLCERYGREVTQTLGCGWQLERQAVNSKDYKVKKQLQQGAKFYYDYAESLLPSGASEIRKEVVESLDGEVRSSSLIENINSGLRPLLETCRGQVEQEMLELFAYVHNHRRFERGKRAGQAPIEILTGQMMEKTWLDSLLGAV